MTMMSIPLISTLAAMMFAAQTTQAPPLPLLPAKDTTPAIMLTGCVGPETPGSYKFTDTRIGATDRPSADDTRKWGEIVIGTGARRMTIRGGLVPSPNMAAQAGAVDQAQVAVTNMPGGPNSGTGDPKLPEFHVTRVQPSNGSCR